MMEALSLVETVSPEHVVTDGVLNVHQYANRWVNLRNLLHHDAGRHEVQTASCRYIYTSYRVRVRVTVRDT